MVAYSQQVPDNAFGSFSVLWARHHGPRFSIVLDELRYIREHIAVECRIATSASFHCPRSRISRDGIVEPVLVLAGGDPETLVSGTATSVCIPSSVTHLISPVWGVSGR
jgi:hypothetical protein